jgi:UDP-N-acetylglucosamine acyltransferase
MTHLAVVREISPSAQVAPDAEIGPFCCIGPKVTIGPGTVLRRRVCVEGHAIIGSLNVIEEGCVLGAAPQDLKYGGRPTLLIIGHRNYLGPRVTAHIGTENGGYLTRIGDDNALLDGCHIAHDCYIDNHARLGRQVLLAGHVLVQTGAVMEDQSAAHHFTTIGRHARVLARTPVRRDVPPYTVFGSDDYENQPPAVQGAHEEGIRAAALSAAEEKELRQALRELFDDEEALQTKIEQLVNLGVEGQALELCQFCQRSLQGVYGRYHELFRGKMPPQAEKYLPAEILAAIRRQPA